MTAKWGARFRGRGVFCVTSSGATTYRPNKTAAGMTNTFRRHKRGHSNIANTLAVRGTLDPLSRWHWNIGVKYERARCVHCGADHPNIREARMVLSDSGKRRLAQLRRQS